MKILVTGSGGRGMRRVACIRSGCHGSVVAPGAGTTLDGLTNVDIDVMDFEARVTLPSARAWTSRSSGRSAARGGCGRCVRGCRTALLRAELLPHNEGSKTFTKDFLRRHRVDAAYGSFDNADEWPRTEP